MLKHFISLEWKSFFRSASFGTNLVMKIFMTLFVLYFMVMFAALGAGIFYILEGDNGADPLAMVNKFLKGQTSTATGNMATDLGSKPTPTQYYNYSTTELPGSL